MTRAQGVESGNTRSYLDGQPYYCKTCGVGFAEYIACEDGPCELESFDTARARQRAHKKRVQVTKDGLQGRATTYQVTVTRPHGVSIGEMKTYIETAVAAWCGGGDPNDAIFYTGQYPVKVKWVQSQKGKELCPDEGN